MRTIDDFFENVASQTLYHYTSIGALLGIAETRTVWASHVYYLSDSHEIVHACRILSEVLSQRVEHYDGEERVFMEQFRDWLKTVLTSQHYLFVFSLSKQASLLSQWRSYTPHGKGVSLASRRQH
jgi:hypothetical protein